MQAIADDAFYSVYQYLGFGLIFAVICMIALPEVEHKGLRKCLIHQWHVCKGDVTWTTFSEAVLKVLSAEHSSEFDYLPNFEAYGRQNEIGLFKSI